MLSYLAISSLLAVLQAKYTTLLSSGTYGDYDIGEDEFNSLFQSSSHHILYRECADCGSTHQNIWYLRLTNTDTFEPYDYMKSNWFEDDNELGVDFYLYSSLEDALAGEDNGWTACNYDDPGVGFPRDCGPTEEMGCEWNSWADEWASSSCRRKNVKFSVYDETDEPTEEPTPEPTTQPTTEPTPEPSGGPTPEPTVEPTNEPTSWPYEIVWQRGSYGDYLATECEWNELFQTASEYYILYRQCADCDEDYQEIWYRRFTDPENFEPYNYMTSYWYSDNNDMENNFDFGLYSSLEDAINTENAWEYCDYDDCGVGFPRNCGINESLSEGHNWNTNDYLRTGEGVQDFQWSVYTGDGSYLDKLFMAGKGKTIKKNIKKNKKSNIKKPYKPKPKVNANISASNNKKSLFKNIINNRITTFIIGFMVACIVIYGYNKFTSNRKSVTNDESTPLLQQRYV